MILFFSSILFGIVLLLLSQWLLVEGWWRDARTAFFLMMAISGSFKYLQAWKSASKLHTEYQDQFGFWSVYAMMFETSVSEVATHNFKSDLAVTRRADNLSG